MFDYIVAGIWERVRNVLICIGIAFIALLVLAAVGAFCALCFWLDHLRFTW